MSIRSILKERRQRRMNRRRRALFLLMTVSGGVASAALGQATAPQAPLRFKTDYLGYAASVSPRLTYTDNVDLAPSPFERDDLIASTLFSASAIYSRRRFTGIIGGDLDFSYLTQANDFRVNQNIGGVGTVTLKENWLYIDVAGQSTRQLLGDNARFSINQNAARGQRADVNSYSVSPFLFHRFADQSAVEARYRFSQVFIRDRNSDVNPGFDDFLNDSRAQEVFAAYETRPIIDRLRLRASLYGNETIQSGSSILPRIKYRQGTAQLEGEYALTRQVSLLGAVGYDEIDTDTPVPFFDDDRLSGVFWRAGVGLRPGRRSQLRLLYGRRYDEDYIDAALTYQVSPRVTAVAGASRLFQTRTQGVASQFRDRTLQTLAFADRLREGETLPARDVIAIANRIGGERFEAQTLGIGATDVAYGGLNAVFDRTTASVNVIYEDSDFGFRDIQTVGVAATATRQMTRRLRAYADGFYRRADTGVDTATCAASPFLFGFNSTVPGFDAAQSCGDFAALSGVTNTIGGRVGAAYTVYRNVSLFGEYAHTTRFSPIEPLEYQENAVTVGVTLDF
ncbi:MAG: hypothetical protein AAF850_00895 [Pseudomonadota bacterium]